MKTPRPTRPPRLCSESLALLGALLLLGAPCATATPRSEPAPKSYTLYMGIDLDVGQGKQTGRVQDVIGDALVARIDGQVRKISTTAGPVSLRVENTLKLGGSRAMIDNLKSERAYSAANDPWRQWASRGTIGNSDLALGQMVDALNARDQNASRAANPALGIGQGVAAAQQAGLDSSYRSASSAFNQSSLDAQGDQYNAGLIARQALDEEAKGLYDAVRVDFAVSSPTPLPNPYVVLLAQYHDPNEPKGTAHIWIYAQALNPINDQPRKVHILKGGFPRGFQLEKLNVHLFSQGREVATNVADKRIDLTRDEAFEYLVIDYLGTHREATLPPTLALGHLGANAREHFSADQLQQGYFVKVDKDGMPQGVFLDEACARKVDDAQLEAIFGDCRFRPALAKGKPVAGVARVTLDNLKT